MSRKCSECAARWAFDNGLCRECMAIAPGRTSRPSYSTPPPPPPWSEEISKAAQVVAPPAGTEAEAGTRLWLPSESPEEWAYVEEVLRGPMERLVDLDAMLTKFSALGREPKQCTFFADIPTSEEAGLFDFDAFFALGVPLLLEVALEMRTLFTDPVPIAKTYSSWAEPQTLARSSTTLTRRQCACLLAHSFFGSLRRPADMQPNDFRFTAVELFLGTARSPNSATTLLNYFTVLGREGVPEGSVRFERRGYPKGASPWQWATSEAPLCEVRIDMRS